MLFVLKVISLLLASIPFLQKGVVGLATGTSDSYLHMVAILFHTVFIIGSVMILWIVHKKTKIRHSHITKLEIFLLYFIFSLSIYMTDEHGDIYKFLYIIIIITYTIELAGRRSILLAIISSGLLLIPNLLQHHALITLPFNLALSTVFLLIAWTLGHYVKSRQTHIEYLTHITHVDGLTGIYNHRYFHECIERLYKKHEKAHTPLSLLMIDLDFFKEYNDLFGHQQGDALLKAIISLIQKNLRKQDLLFRYGGDEFCAILENTELEQALAISEQIRSSVAEYHHSGMEHLSRKRLSLSIGVASMSEEIDHHLVLIDKADSALYRAKYLQRNRVEAYGTAWHAFKGMSTVENEDLLKYIKTLISVIDTKDKYTYSHTERVAHYSELLADYLQLDEEEKRLLIFGAYLHDLGKINISKEILIKDEKLTLEEWRELQTHPTESVTIIEKIEGFEQVIPIVKHHHERYDGSGYPDNLQGKEIPKLARILSVADSFDAMTHKRPYQNTKTFEEALNELIHCKGTQFDPEYVDLFVEMLKDMN